MIPLAGLGQVHLLQSVQVLNTCIHAANSLIYNNHYSERIGPKLTLLFRKFKMLFGFYGLIGL